MNATEDIERVIVFLRELGPLKAKTIADLLGRPNARSISMLLQWQSTRVKRENGRWRLTLEETNKKHE